MTPEEVIRQLKDIKKNAGKNIAAALKFAGETVTEEARRNIKRNWLLRKSIGYKITIRSGNYIVTIRPQKGFGTGNRAAHIYGWKHEQGWRRKGKIIIHPFLSPAIKTTRAKIDQNIRLKAGGR